MEAAFGSTRTELDLGQSDQDVRARPFLFLVLEAERPLAGGARFALDDLDEVLAGRSERIGGRQVSRGTRDGKRSLSIRMSGQFLSKDHAAFRRTGQNWTVEDLGSRNGVYVNGTHISAPTVLGPGDLVSLGRAFFIFEFDETEEVDDLDAEDVTAVPLGFLTLLPGLAQ